jgi:hypothetical protein
LSRTILLVARKPIPLTDFGIGPSRCFRTNFVFVRERPPGDSNKIQKKLSALVSLNLNNKLMNFSNNLTVKTLLLEKACDLWAQLGEKYLVIWTGDVQTG